MIAVFQEYPYFFVKEFLVAVKTNMYCLPITSQEITREIVVFSLFQYLDKQR